MPICAREYEPTRASQYRTPQLSDRELRDEAMTMMLAGHETTANLLAWTLYTLARAPEARARLEAEKVACRCASRSAGCNQSLQP